MCNHCLAVVRRIGALLQQGGGSRGGSPGPRQTRHPSRHLLCCCARTRPATTAGLGQGQGEEGGADTWWTPLQQAAAEAWLAQHLSVHATGSAARIEDNRVAVATLEVRRFESRSRNPSMGELVTLPTSRQDPTPCGPCQHSCQNQPLGSAATHLVLPAGVLGAPCALAPHLS